MTSWLGQYCLNVTDLERSVAFYTSLGLTCTSRTEIPDAWEAIVENPSGGSKFQMAQQKNQSGRLDLGTGFWKLYVNTHHVDATFRTALTQGATAESAPQRMERWRAHGRWCCACMASPIPPGAWPDWCASCPPPVSAR